MSRLVLAAALLSSPIVAQEAASEAAPSPNEIVAQASAEEWVAIPADDLLVMTLAPDPEGDPREVVIQLMPAPFSQGWVENIRTLTRAKWYDGITVNRVQDNYVVQWGDPNHDNPEAEGKAKPLPDGLRVMEESDYTAQTHMLLVETPLHEDYAELKARDARRFTGWRPSDAYAPSPFQSVMFKDGWPIARDESSSWPIHCYGMVGVGRSYSPDTGSGAELYTVIGHAPRHLDRNIGLAGRIVSGIEHLSSLPRGSGALGFYTEDEFDLRTPILTVRVASDLPEAERPAFEYLSTDGETFARYADARANRRDPFFIVPAGGADICNIPVPVRRVVE